MAGLARRLAPAAALGGLAVVIVGVADPAIAGRTAATPAPETVPQAAAPEVAAPEQLQQPQSEQPQVQEPEQSPAEEPALPATTCADGQAATGDAYMTPWGPVQVQATVVDGAVCEVHAVAWPSNDRKSQMINAYAVPQLDAAATASPTSFDYVSGATYTSEGYHRSLQSILDAM